MKNQIIFLETKFLIPTTLFELFCEMSVIVLFVDLVSDGILQMALGSNLLRKFGGRILRTLLRNAFCYILRHQAAMPLSTKRIMKLSGPPQKRSRKGTLKRMTVIL